MTHEQAFKELLQGKKLTAKSWDAERFISANKDGQIVDNEGKSFNMMTTKEKSWELWTEPKAEVMDSQTALSELFKGKKVKSTSWDSKRFISMNKDGQIVDNEGKSFNMMTTKEKSWELWTEPKAEGDNSELISLINGLKSELTDLKKSMNNDGMSNENQELLKMVYGVDTVGELKELFKSEWSQTDSKIGATKVIVKYVPFCWLGGRKINTVASYYRDMRNIIKEVGGDYQDLGLDLFVLSGEVYERIADKSTNAVKEKNEVGGRDEYDGEHIEAIIKDLKEKIINDDIPVAKQQTKERARAYLYATYLALVTGRRNTEILKTLEIVKEGNEWFYKGIVKKDNSNSKIKAYSLDTDYEFLAGLIEQLRKDLDTKDIDTKKVNSNYNRIFNRAFKKLTQTDYTFHDAREIYADLLYIKEGLKEGGWSEEFTYKSNVLGHEIKKDRLKATQNYMTKKRG